MCCRFRFFERAGNCYFNSLVVIDAGVCVCDLSRSHHLFTLPLTPTSPHTQPHTHIPTHPPTHPLSHTPHTPPLTHSSPSSDGTILDGLYRKSHIPDSVGYQEKYYFSPGDTGCVCVLDVCVFVFDICVRCVCV